MWSILFSLKSQLSWVMIDFRHMFTFPNSQKQKQVAKEKKEKKKNVFQVKRIVQILRVYLHCEIKKLKLNALFKTNIISIVYQVNNQRKSFSFKSILIFCLNEKNATILIALDQYKNKFLSWYLRFYNILRGSLFEIPFSFRIRMSKNKIFISRL
jgi:hypothetical protein